MKGLIYKEVRSLLPVWLLAMALAVLPVWLVWPGPQGLMLQELGPLVFAPFGLGVLLLGLAPFGQELNWGTFPVLLAQPVSRRRLWGVKVAAAGIALALAFLAFCISNHFRVESTLETMKHTLWRNAFERPSEQTPYFAKLIAETRRAAVHDSLLIGGLEVLAGFAGGLWTTLLFRQVTAAFWLTLLVPMGLAVLSTGVLKSLPEAVSQAGLAVVLGGYSAAGFLWARRFFLRVQDAQWTGGVIALPGWGELAVGRGSGRARRKFKPLRALVRKEFQSQQVNLLLAGGLLLVHLGVLAVRRWGVEYLATRPFLDMTLEMVPLLWLVMPLLVGSVAVAEERKLEMFQSALCLPAGRRTQFCVKLLVALGLGVLLGGVVPLVVEKLAPAGNASVAYNGMTFLGGIRSIVFIQLWGSVGLALLAFYGSTLTRNALQAMGAGLLGAILTCLIILGALHAGDSPALFLWRGPLIAWVGWPVMLLTVFWLSYRNCGKLLPDVRTWIRNASTWILGLFCVSVVTTTIYHRAWEAWLPEEPPHQPTPMGLSFMNFTSGKFRASLKRQTRPSPKLEAMAFAKAAVLSDGRLWLQQQQARLQDQREFRPGSVVWYATGPWHTGFVPGSDWKDVALTVDGCFAIKADGTLWDLSENGSNGAPPKAVGQDNDWDAISAGWQHVCALKTDGTLWQWGWRGKGARRPPGGRSGLVPTQVGTDNDWVAVCNSWNMSAAIKTDGTVWRWGNRFLPEKWLNGACTDPVSLTLRDHALAAVCADGTLWIGGDLTNSVYVHLVGPTLARRGAREMVRWGNDSDWKEIRFVGWGKAAGVKADGTLWEWDYEHTYGSVRTATIPSRYSDWMAVCAQDNAFLALARDGSVCLWGDPQDGRYWDLDGPDPRRLLMPSRIKAARIADLAR